MSVNEEQLQQDIARMAQEHDTKKSKDNPNRLTKAEQDDLVNNIIPVLFNRLKHNPCILRTVQKGKNVTEIVGIPRRVSQEHIENLVKNTPTRAEPTNRRSSTGQIPSSSSTFFPAASRRSSTGTIPTATTQTVAPTEDSLGNNCHCTIS